MPWTISEWNYKPGLKGVEFSLSQGPDHLMFLMPSKVIAAHFHVGHSTDEIMSAFSENKHRIEKFATLVKDECPFHKNGQRLLSSEVCQEKAL